MRAVRASRSADAWRAALDGMRHAARDGRNLVPPIIAAVEAKATVGEIADAMRAVFGEYEETATYEPCRGPWRLATPQLAC